MDEGSTATEREYKEYVRRLFNIFLSGPSGSVRVIKKIHNVENVF